MKNALIRILQSLVIVVVMVSFAQADHRISFKKKEVSGNTSVLKDDGSGTTNNASRYFAYGTPYGAAFTFVAGSGYTLTSIKVMAQRTGAGGTCTAISAKLSTTAAPDTVLATSTNTQDATSWDTSETEKEWTFAGYLLTNAVTYRVLLDPGSLCGGSSNFPQLRFKDTTGDPASSIYTLNPPTTWTLQDGSAQIWYKTYGY